MRKCRRERLRRENRNKRRNRTRSQTRKPQKSPGLKNLRISITAPSVFDIVSNPDESLAFFRRFHKLIIQKKRVHMDLANVTVLNPSALLYILSLFDAWTHKGLDFDVSGNEPIERSSRLLIQQSGFYSHVSMARTVEYSSATLVRIEKGRAVDGEFAGKILEFCEKNVKAESTQLLRDNYQAIIELMTNTYEHASPIGRGNLQWYMMAVLDEANRNVSITFLDNGIGIPKSLKKQVTESLSLLLAEIFSNTSSAESELIISALDGVFRTRTGERNRGKGLPAIYKLFRRNSLNDLVIVSSKAHVVLTSEARNHRILEERLIGTLYTWKILRN